MKKILGLIVICFLIQGCNSPQQWNTQVGSQVGSWIDSSNQRFNSLSSKNIDRIILSSSNDLYRAADVCGNKQKYYFIFYHSAKGEEARTGYKPSGSIAYCSAKKLNTEPVFGSRGWRKYMGYWEPTNFSLYKTNFNQVTFAKKITKEEKKDIIIKARSTCLEFGYKDGSESLSNCMKDIYLKQIEAETKNQNQTTITAVPKRKIDPSVWDDLLNISKGMGEGKTFTESLGSVGSSSSSTSSKIQCFKSGERISGTNKICSYNCMGSEVVQNISSTSICALSIDLN